MADDMLLTGNMINWQTQKPKLDALMYELGLGRLLGMEDGDVPITPPTMTNENAGMVSALRRELRDHTTSDEKGFGNIFF